MLRAFAVLVAVLLSGCSAVPCELESECGCYARSRECAMKTEACWCPSVCDARINCVCGGGKFLKCEARP